MKAKYAGILAAVLGSVCCVGPLLLVAIGLGAGAAVIGRYHWWFVVAAVIVLAWAWTKHFREKARCACEHRAMDGRGISLLTLILASAIVAALAALNANSYVFASSPPALAAITNSSLQRVVIPIEGLSCATCEIAARHALKRVDGVASAHVSVATKNATVDYEPAKTNPKQLVAAINSTGFRATLPHEAIESINEKSPVDPGGAADATADRISVFKAPLVCPAAPQIGCGSASKPILLDLERQPGVREAWLNRAGTRIAIVWKSDANATTRHKVVAELKEDQVTELDGKARDEAVNDFLSGKGWYHGADVDRLSEEEAGIIAGRLVRRVQAKTILAQDKAERLERILADAYRKRIVQESYKEELPVHQLAGDFLNEKQLAILKEAIEAGVRPLPNEN